MEENGVFDHLRQWKSRAGMFVKYTETSDGLTVDEIGWRVELWLSSWQLASYQISQGSAVAQWFMSQHSPSLAFADKSCAKN